MSDLLPFTVVTTKNVSEHCQMSPAEQNYPHCRNSSFQVQTISRIRKVCLLRHLISHLHSPNHSLESYFIKLKSSLVYFLSTIYIFPSQETGQTFKPSPVFKYLKSPVFFHILFSTLNFPNSFNPYSCPMSFIILVLSFRMLCILSYWY